MKARITITLKPAVLDPQGKAIEARCTRSASAGRRRAPGQIHRARSGREAIPRSARAEIERMCEKLLANTVIENYAYELEAA